MHRLQCCNNSNSNSKDTLMEEKNVLSHSWHKIIILLFFAIAQLELLLCLDTVFIIGSLLLIMYSFVGYNDDNLAVA